MIVLGIGTNIGDRIAYLETALRFLAQAGFKIDKISPIYESPALLKPDSPKEWDINYLNIAVSGTINTTPQELLSKVKLIEQQIGRQNRGLWAPREIDIDILAYNDLIIYEDNLRIPHISLCERDFAILPFADIAPDWCYPDIGIFAGTTASEIANSLQNRSARKTEYKLD